MSDPGCDDALPAVYHHDPGYGLKTRSVLNLIATTVHYCAESVQSDSS